jgi:hypothetical protein
MAANLKADKIIHPSTGQPAIDVDAFATANTTARYNRQTINYIDTVGRTAGATWTLGTSFGPYSMAAGSTLKISYTYPCRNDAATWGGLYFEPQISFNGGTTWYSLGSRGYDAVMKNGQAAIRRTSNSNMYIDPGILTPYTVNLRYYFRSYDGTVGINNGINHDINIISGTATLLSGDAGNQHYGNWIIEEMALYGGVV